MNSLLKVNFLLKEKLKFLDLALLNHRKGRLFIHHSGEGSFTKSLIHK